MLAAKVSTGYVAEIGTMRISDEVDAPAFRHGWERGQDYQREQGFGTGLRKIA